MKIPLKPVVDFTLSIFFGGTKRKHRDFDPLSSPAAALLLRSRDSI